MPNGIPTNPPNVKTVSLAQIVRKLWGEEWTKKEVVYEFGNKREFRSTDQGTSGIYK